MSGEPLWRGPVGQLAASLLGQKPRARGWDPAGEVEVWRAGDRTLDSDIATLVGRHGFDHVMEAVQNATPEGVCWNCATPLNDKHRPYTMGACYSGRAGDRPVPPTRDQVRQALKSWLVRTPAVSFDWRDEDDAVDGATDAVWELLSGGVPTEPEDTHDG